MEWFSWELVCLRWAPQLIISCSEARSEAGAAGKYFTAAEDEPKPKKPPTKVSQKGWYPSATQNGLMRWEWEERQRWWEKNGEKLWVHIEFLWLFFVKEWKESSQNNKKTELFKHFTKSAPTRLLDILMSLPLIVCHRVRWETKCTELLTLAIKNTFWIGTNNKTRTASTTSDTQNRITSSYNQTIGTQGDHVYQYKQIRSTRNDIALMCYCFIDFSSYCSVIACHIAKEVSIFLNWLQAHTVESLTGSVTAKVFKVQEAWRCWDTHRATSRPGD